MKWKLSRTRTKLVFLSVAMLLAAASLIVSHQLTSDLQTEERARMKVWAEAMRSLMSADEHTDLNLVLTVINGNNTIPLVVTTAKGEVRSHRNLPPFPKSERDSIAQLRRVLLRMKEQGLLMRVKLPPPSPEQQGEELCIYYEESLMLRRLATYPYVQLIVAGLFALIALFALLASKRAEQNKLWVGLSKETAHQLGTPISSLMAWIEVLRENYPDDDLLPEMNEDVKRLEMIAERFSKVGSVPELKTTRIEDVLSDTLRYLRRRSSQHVSFVFETADGLPPVPLSAPLFAWVVEVICKNAIDAMQGKGRIVLRSFVQGKRLVIDIEDTGRGIARKNFATVFRPGYTTKARGWGLGLSLAKRIVSEYHHGKIYVLRSELGVGTCFRIELPLRDKASTA